MVDFDHPDRTRSILATVPRNVLREIFRFWASYGYTTRSVGFAQEHEFDRSDPVSPRGYGWEEVGGSGWWFLLYPSFVPEGRGSKEHKEMIKRRDEAIENDRKANYPLGGDLF